MVGLISLVVMLVIAAAACKSSDEAGKASANPEPGEKADSSGNPTEGEPLTFSVTLPSEGVDNEHSMIGKEWLKLMEQKMGRKIDIKFNYIPSSEYDEKVKLMIASNDLTDFFMTPLFYDTTEMAKQGQILELSQYKDLMPNYMNYLSTVKNGMARVSDAEGHIYRFVETSIPRFPPGQGMLIQNVSSFRYDLFKANNIKVPQTWDELYDAAKKLKQLYPDKYPVNTRWNDLRSLFWADHVQSGIYWDGNQYVYGVLQDGYKDAIQFAHKLYSEKLLDPEYTIDTDDTLKRKALNGDNFMWLADWFTTPGEYTRLSNDGKIFAVSLYPDNPKYGTAWQQVTNGNDPDLGWAQFCISAKAKNPEDIIKFVDAQYSDDVIRLITWGIEGVTYKIGDDGNPTFMDSFKTAPDPWLEGDKYGIRASRHYRPGLQIAADSKAFVDFAATDYTVFNGKYEEVPIEKSPYLRSLPMPNNKYVPSWYTEPAIQLTQDENQKVSEIMNPITTFVTEQQAKFVSGKASFDDWPVFIDKVKKMKIDEALKIYNDAAQRALSK
jgi:putative aldouronate transport system substrate-binding protein